MNDGMITKGNWSKFLTFTGEKLLLVRRKHVFVIFLPILFTSLVLFLFLFFNFFLFIQFLSSITLFFSLSVLLVIIALSFITKIITDWYYHLYILTNRKILEVWYTPLASHAVNDVHLDKVNCTEIDLKVDGFVHELMDVGDVVITFDRPTHQEEFVLKDIHKPDKVEKFLTRSFMDHETKDSLSPMWFRERNVFVRHS